MDRISAKFTVLFEDPFWIGLYERWYNGKYDVCKITFGPEPKDYEVYEFMLKNWRNMRFSPQIKEKNVVEKAVNPKRMQRQIKKQLVEKGIGTKAQQALKLQHEEGKIERKSYSKEQREEEKLRQFELKQQKRREKHKGH